MNRCLLAFCFASVCRRPRIAFFYGRALAAAVVAGFVCVPLLVFVCVPLLVFVQDAFAFTAVALRFALSGVDVVALVFHFAPPRASFHSRASTINLRLAVLLGGRSARGSWVARGSRVPNRCRSEGAKHGGS